VSNNHHHRVLPFERRYVIRLFLSPWHAQVTHTGQSTQLQY
jgi:hypothetical protein